MIYNLVDKTISLSNECFHKENLSITKNLLLQNDYPIKFINYYIKKRLDKIKYSSLNNDILYTDNNNNDTDNNNSIFYRKRVIAKTPKVGIPFTGKFFENISRALKQHGIICIPLINKNLSDVVIKGKDKFSKNVQTNIVYKFDCNECNASYVGESKREALIRINEHKNRIDQIIEKEKKQK